MKIKPDRALLLAISFLSVVIVAFITVFIFAEGLPTFGFVSLWHFIAGKSWFPSSSPPSFGILPLIVGTILTAALGGLIAVPLGVAVAIYLSEFATGMERAFFKPFVEIIAALPSVILGFLGMSLIAPYLLDHFDIDTGLNLFNASILLGLMGIPIVASFSEDALSSISQDYRYASLALGASKWETMVKVVLPAASMGVMKSIMLAIGRLMGETMVVLMASGNAAIIPQSIFDPVKSMAATIASEMGETPVGSHHYHVLFAIGIILFLLTLVISIVAYAFTARRKI